MYFCLLTVANKIRIKEMLFVKKENNRIIMIIFIALISYFLAFEDGWFLFLIRYI